MAWVCFKFTAALSRGFLTPGYRVIPTSLFLINHLNVCEGIAWKVIICASVVPTVQLSVGPFSNSIIHGDLYCSG